jgi:hypothetical protein
MPERYYILPTLLRGVPGCIHIDLSGGDRNRRSIELPQAIFKNITREVCFYVSESIYDLDECYMFCLVDRSGNKNSSELLARQIHRSLWGTLVDTHASSPSCNSGICLSYGPVSMPTYWPISLNHLNRSINQFQISKSLHKSQRTNPMVLNLS